MWWTYDLYDIKCKYDTKIEVEGEIEMETKTKMITMRCFFFFSFIMNI